MFSLFIGWYGLRIFSSESENLFFIILNNKSLCWQKRSASSSLCKLVDVFAGTTFDFFGTDGELKHNSAVLALLLADLGRWHLVDRLAATAFDLLRPRDELQHGTAVVANQMRSGHRWDSSRD